MEFDVFIPSQNLAFEYQGEIHYEDSLHYGETKYRQHVDQQKRSICEKAGIKLVTVPYWWDGTLTALKQMMNEQGVEIK